MTYEEIHTLITDLDYPQCAIFWKDSEKIPDIFIRYYLVDDNTFTNYNETATELKQSRYTFVVYDRKGENMQGIFEELKAKLEYIEGFTTFEDTSDGYEKDTGHYYRQGDIFNYYKED